MGISIDVVGRDQLKVRVLDGPTFQLDVDKIKSLRGKKPIFGIDPVTKTDKFQYWEIPQTELGAIASKFKRGELICQSPKCKELFENFFQVLDPGELKPIVRKFDWIRPPKFKEQEDYILLSEKERKLICAWDCGLGKGYGTATRASVLGFKKLLIVCPKSVMVNWRTELNKTLQQEALVYHGDVKKRKKLLEEQVDSASIIVTSYSMLSEVNHLEYDQIILDEAQMLAHKTTKAFEQARNLIKNNPKAGVQLASGTPILHKPADLWALVYLLYPAIAGDYWVWKNRYEEVIKSITKNIIVRDRTGKPVYHPDGSVKMRRMEIPIVTRTRNLDELGQRIKPFTKRLKREDFVNFEDAVDIVTTPMTSRQKDLYRRIAKDVILNLSTGDLKIVNALSEMTRLLQVAEGAYNLEPKFKDSGKMDYIEEQIEKSDDKLIAWFNFKPGTYLMHEAYKKTSVMFNGDMTQNQRTLALWAFQGVSTKADELEYKKLAHASKWKLEPGEAQQLFGVMSRASVGFNLPACNRQVFPSFNWNGNILKQTADRIKRLDQTADTVFTTFLVSEDTIEYTALHMILNNLKNCSQILDGTSDVTYNQIQELMRELKRK